MSWLYVLALLVYLCSSESGELGIVPLLEFVTPGLSSNCFNSARPHRWSNITTEVGTTDTQFFEWRFQTYCWDDGQGLTVTMDAFPEGMELVPRSEDVPVLYHYWPSPSTVPGEHIVKIPVDVSAMRPGVYSMNILVGGFPTAIGATIFPVRISIVDPATTLPAQPIRYPLRIIEKFGSALMGPDDDPEFIDQSYHYDMVESISRGSVHPFPHRYTIANGDWGSPMNWVQQKTGGAHLAKFTEYSNVTLFTLGVADLMSDNFEKTIRTLITKFDTTQSQPQMILNSQLGLEGSSTTVILPTWFAVYDSVTAQIEPENTAAGNGQALSMQMFAALSDEALDDVPEATLSSLPPLSWLRADAWLPKVNTECDELVNNRMVPMCGLLFQGGPEEDQASLEDVLSSDTSFQKVLNRLSSNFKLVVSGHTGQQFAWRQQDRLIVQASPRGREVADVTILMDQNYANNLDFEVTFSALEPYSMASASPSSRLQDVIDSLDLSSIEVVVAGGKVGEPGLHRARDKAGQVTFSKEGTICDAIADGMVVLFEPHVEFALVPHSYCHGDVARPSPLGNEELAEFEVDSVVADSESPLCVVSLTGSEVIALLQRQWTSESASLLATSSRFVYLYDSSQAPASLIIETVRLDGQSFDHAQQYSVVMPKSMLSDEAWSLSQFSATCYEEVLVSDALIEATWIFSDYEYGAPLMRQVDIHEVMGPIRITTDEVDSYENGTEKVILSIHAVEPVHYESLEVYRVGSDSNLEQVGLIDSLPAYEWRAFALTAYPDELEDLKIVIQSDLWEPNDAMTTKLMFQLRKHHCSGARSIVQGLSLIWSGVTITCLALMHSSG